ncbi:DUF6502 family protein [Wenzhouxiangella marina]|uniref:DUF6502 family protein n=1 Tax=Wenzhouxiangella marina TaxID=1579979 RepID=UPI0012E0FC61|nr:DUF6502 family protein [Wenzhouxiangella marina]MBB6086884.1 hypothetical protein [Wenzhouxiangella marina]
MRVAERMLRPVARLLVGKLSATVAITILKEAYIAEATRKMRREQPGRRITKSALALWTGLDTRAISQLETRKRPEVMPAHELCPEAAVLHAWNTEARYRDRKTKQPKDLGVYGRGVSLQTLVSRVAGRNVTSTTVLDKLAQNGNLKLVPGDNVRLINPNYVPTTDEEQKMLEATADSIGRHMETVAHNMESDKAKGDWVQNEIGSARIPAEDLPELRKAMTSLLNEQGKAADKAIKQAQASGKRVSNQSVAVGYYYWEEEPED